MREVVDINLGGVVYSLRPTWSAYAEIEARTNQSIRALWYKFATGDVRLSEMTAILVAGMKAEDPAMNVGENKAMQVLFDAGPWWDQPDGVNTKLVQYLEALGWTPEQREKIQAEVEKQSQATEPSA